MNDNDTMTGEGPHPLLGVIAEHGRLRLSEIGDRYSTYRVLCDDYRVVYLEHGTCRELSEAWEIDVSDEWEAWVTASRPRPLDGFFDHLRTMVIDPDVWDDWLLCSDCGGPVHEFDLHTTCSGDRICTGCRDEKYTRCYRCDDLFRDDDVERMPNDEYYCESCRDGIWRWCDNCDEWESVDYDCDDTEECGQDCASPQRMFALRNDGVGVLRNDERITVPLPAGVISEEGMRSIIQAVTSWSYKRLCEAVAAVDNQSPEADSARVEHSRWHQAAYGASSLGHEWQTGRGNFTKRFSRYAHETYKLKVPPDLLSKIGTIAREHSTGQDYRIEVTRDLNQPRYLFANEDSCWWSSEYQSRCALKTNGGFALRSFDGPEVTGRAWVMPLRLIDDPGLRRLTPTFRTEDPDAFVVFNGYGDLSGYSGARIMSHLAGWTYRKIGFGCSPMWINSESGYLVAAEEIVAQFHDVYLDVAQHSDLFAIEQAEKAAATVVAEEGERIGA